MLSTTISKTRLRLAFYAKKGPLSFLKAVFSYLNRQLNPSAKPIISEQLLIYDFLNLTDRPKIMIDVGAAVGEVSMPFLKTGWEVHAFEPVPATLKILQAIQTKYAKLHVTASAVSDRDGEIVDFFTSSESLGVSTTTPFLDSHKPTFSVPTISLNKYIADTGIQQVDFLKIDVEGADFHVLKGFPWAKIKPDVVMSEFDRKKAAVIGIDYDQILQLLIEQGYFSVIAEYYPLKHYGAGGGHKFKTFHFVGQDIPSTEVLGIGSWGNIISIQSKANYENFRGICAAALAQTQAH